MNRSDQIARIHIELDETEPAIWRRVEVPLTTSLKGLHDVIQAVMPFQDYHLFAFEFADKRYGIPDPDWDDLLRMHDAKNIKLGALVDRGVSRFAYIYDFGDNWQHTVTIEATVVADPAVGYPRFIDGARRAPPEDVGGIPGFEEFLEVVSRPRHRERKRLLEWYGGPFDPDEIDLATITAGIRQLTRRRAISRAAYAKSRRSGP
jgi:hypothetical protein